MDSMSALERDRISRFLSAPKEPDYTRVDVTGAVKDLLSRHPATDPSILRLFVHLWFAWIDEETLPVGESRLPAAFGCVYFHGVSILRCCDAGVLLAALCYRGPVVLNDPRKVSSLIGTLPREAPKGVWKDEATFFAQLLAVFFTLDKAKLPPLGPASQISEADAVAYAVAVKKLGADERRSLYTPSGSVAAFLGRAGAYDMGMHVMKIPYPILRRFDCRAFVEEAMAASPTAETVYRSVARAYRGLALSRSPRAPAAGLALVVAATDLTMQNATKRGERSIDVAAAAKKIYGLIRARVFPELEVRYTGDDLFDTDAVASSWSIMTGMGLLTRSPLGERADFLMSVFHDRMAPLIDGRPVSGLKRVPFGVVGFICHLAESGFPLPGGQRTADAVLRSFGLGEYVFVADDDYKVLGMIVPFLEMRPVQFQYILKTIFGELHRPVVYRGGKLAQVADKRPERFATAVDLKEIYTIVTNELFEIHAAIGETDYICFAMLLSVLILQVLRIPGLLTNAKIGLAGVLTVYCGYCAGMNTWTTTQPNGGDIISCGVRIQHKDNSICVSQQERHGQSALHVTTAMFTSGVLSQCIGRPIRNTQTLVIAATGGISALAGLYNGNYGILKPHKEGPEEAAIQAQTADSFKTWYSGAFATALTSVVVNQVAGALNLPPEVIKNIPAVTWFFGTTSLGLYAMAPNKELTDQTEFLESVLIQDFNDRVEALRTGFMNSTLETFILDKTLAILIDPLGKLSFTASVARDFFAAKEVFDAALYAFGPDLSIAVNESLTALDPATANSTLPEGYRVMYQPTNSTTKKTLIGDPRNSIDLRTAWMNFLHKTIRDYDFTPEILFSLFFSGSMVLARAVRSLSSAPPLSESTKEKVYDKIRTQINKHLETKFKRNDCIIIAGFVLRHYDLEGLYGALKKVENFSVDMLEVQLGGAYRLSDRKETTKVLIFIPISNKLIEEFKGLGRVQSDEDIITSASNLKMAAITELSSRGDAKIGARRYKQDEEEVSTISTTALLFFIGGEPVQIYIRRATGWFLSFPASPRLMGGLYTLYYERYPDAVRLFLIEFANIFADYGLSTLDRWAGSRRAPQVV